MLIRIVLWLLVVASTVASGQTTTEGTGTQADLQAWHDDAGTLDGDIYIIPAGDFTWSVSNRVTISKNVLIFGRGIGKTNIEYDVDVYESLRQIIGFSPSAEDWRLSNLTIKDEVVNAFDPVDGAPIFVNGGTGWSIDNIRFEAVSDSRDYHAMRIQGTTTGSGKGVVWGCEFYNWTYVSDLKNGDEIHGDHQWGIAVPMGGEQMIVFEDNEMGRSSGFDGDDGSIATVRFNSITDAFVGGHGADSSGRSRGFRWVEVYENSFTYVDVTNRISMVESRSGGGLVFDNTLTPAVTGEPDNFVNLSNYRVFWRNAPWFYADGKNPWDVAYTDDGAGTPGGAGDGVYETGTITSVIDDDEFVDSSKSGVWSLNEWAGYTMRFLGPQGITAAAGSSGNSIVVSPDPGWTTNEWAGWGIRDLSSGWHVVISSNTSDTIVTSTSTSDSLPNFDVSPGDTFDVFVANTIQSNGTDGSVNLGQAQFDNNWSNINGRDYELRKLRSVMDGIGRGVANVTTLFSSTGSSTGQSAVPPGGGYVSTPGEVPWYEWGNTSTGSLGSRIAKGSASAFTVVADVDYFDYEASFDGTAGVGVGVKADIEAGGDHETATTTGVGYWVTDEGDWNAEEPGPDGQLYQWDGDSWELYYTPLDYPHPVRATLAPLPSVGGAAYSGRLRGNGSGARPVRANGAGSPLIFDN